MLQAAVRAAPVQEAENLADISDLQVLQEEAKNLHTAHQAETPRFAERILLLNQEAETKLTKSPGRIKKLQRHPAEVTAEAAAMVEAAAGTARKKEERKKAED